MPVIETGWMSSVTKHPDGRVTLTRASHREGMFLHLELTEAEQAALLQVLQP